ncbi:MAG: cupin domain-containing protein [Proteobacteria bacterium]|nr:cupin domain-containing protein [Pseudomonadota bacterium]
MKHTYYPEVKGLNSLSLGLEGSAKMMVKLITDDTVCIEIERGGHTPDHTHKDKERVVVMSGSGEIKLGEERKSIKTADFLEFDADEQHQILNDQDETLVFMCFRNQN